MKYVISKSHIKLPYFQDVDPLEQKATFTDKPEDAFQFDSLEEANEMIGKLRGFPLLAQIDMLAIPYPGILEYMEMPTVTVISEQIEPFFSEKTKELLKEKVDNTFIWITEGDTDIELTCRFIGHAVNGEPTEENYRRLAYAVNKAAELDLFELGGPCPPVRQKFYTQEKSLLFVTVMTRFSLEELRTHNNELFPQEDTYPLPGDSTVVNNSNFPGGDLFQEGSEELSAAKSI